jgi:N-methylhydantoinase B/oxoprolinase/acetone carboxylase alpha subunit
MTVEADEIVVSALCDRSKVSPWGVHGGKPGERLAFLVKHERDDAFRTFSEAFGTISPTKFSNVRLRRGDAVMLRSPSGGGYGPPRERPAERVAEDVASGFVSKARARADYGVVIRSDGMVDHDATETLRREMAVGVG